MKNYNEETANNIKIICIISLVVISLMVAVAGSIVLPRTDRNIHGHYRVVDTVSVYR